MARMFGTDGVRGIANTELTCDLAFKLGQASAAVSTSECRTEETLSFRAVRRAEESPASTGPQGRGERSGASSLPPTSWMAANYKTTDRLPERFAPGNPGDASTRGRRSAISRNGG